MEELASHGYIVVGVDHSYVSTGTVFPDGRLAPAHRLDYFIEDELRPYLDEWVADARFVLDTLSKINTADPKDMFTNRLDHYPFLYGLPNKIQSLCFLHTHRDNASPHRALPCREDILMEMRHFCLGEIRHYHFGRTEF